LSEADRRQIADLYDANLAYGDSPFGRVLDFLRQYGIYDNTVVILLADHGEAMYEHGYQGHNTQVYQESMHIPLIIKLKGSSNHRATISQRVRTVDIFPTLVDLFGFSARRLQTDGRSFLPYFVSHQDDGREVITQTTRERQYSRLDANYKYIADLIYNVEELYDLSKDPGETKNLFAAHPVIARYYRSRMLGQILVSRGLSGRNKTERAVIDEAARENLKALGYLD
jgi:arylsulfatase A-like enzyme